jgi:hypothetical protein
MENRQDSSISDWIEELSRMPAGGQRACLSFAVTNHGKCDQVRMIENRAKCVGDRVAKLSALV